MLPPPTGGRADVFWLSWPRPPEDRASQPPSTLTRSRSAATEKFAGLLERICYGDYSLCLQVRSVSGRTGENPAVARRSLSGRLRCCPCTGSPGCLCHWARLRNRDADLVGGVFRWAGSSRCAETMGMVAAVLACCDVSGHSKVCGSRRRTTPEAHGISNHHPIQFCRSGRRWSRGLLLQVCGKSPVGILARTGTPAMDVGCFRSSRLRLLHRAL